MKMEQIEEVESIKKLKLEQIEEVESIKRIKNQVSISPTFYEQHLFIQKYCAQLFCTYGLGLISLVERKLAQKLLVKCW